MPSSRPGLAPGARSPSVTGCEDTIISNNNDARLRLNRGRQIKIGTWNCGGLSYTTRELCRELQYDILVLTETHKKGTFSSSRNYIASDPPPDTDSFSGVAIMLSDRVAKCVSHSGCCGSRIAYAVIKAKPCNLFILGVYMPHKMRKEKPFPSDTLSQLEEIIAKVHPHTCIILLGDLNCKLGRSNGKLTGRWCAQKLPNAEGKHFLDMMQRFNLTATSTFFQPRRSKLGNATYLAKNPEYRPSQIDYILLSARWATSIRNCKVKWGVSCQRWGRHYDHGLVECSLKARLIVRRVEPSKDFGILKSDRDIRQRFNENVSSNLTRRPFNQDDPTESVVNLRNSISEAASSVLPCKKKLPSRKRHVSAHTKHLYEERQSKFTRMSKEERKAASHSISKSIRDDYVSYIDGVLMDMEAAERTGNTRELTRLRKLLSGKSNASTTMPSKDMQGSPILSQKHLLTAWNSFLSEKFASPTADSNRRREQTVSPHDTLTSQELEDALSSLKSGKAPGPDQIPIEAYQQSSSAKAELFRIARLLWDTENIPEEIISGIFIMLYKKNDRNDFGNYRAICLLCHSYKLLSAIIARRLHVHLAPILPDSQAGFRPARGTRDNVCALKWSISMILREAREAVITFIDYKAAFDTESQLFLDEALSAAGVSIKVRRVIQSVFSAASGCVKIDNELSEPFNISRGVLQGDIFSPVAFIAGLWRIFATHESPTAGITLGSTPYEVKVSSLEYADDAGLLDDNVADASARMSAISRGSREDAAMIISIPKTKTLHIHKTVEVSGTSEEEIVALHLHHKCPDCARSFPTLHGMRVHRGRWCDGGQTVRSRKGSLADKAVQLSKRKAAENARDHVYVEGEEIENVHSFVYLGSKIQCDGDDLADVKHRMAIAQAEFSALSQFWQDRRLPLSVKLRIYKAAVCSTLTHACEAWTLTAAVRKKVNGFNSRCLHVITGEPYRDTATRPAYDLLLAIRRRRLRFLGHVLRMDQSRLVRRTLTAYVHGGHGAPDGSLLDDCQQKSMDRLAEMAHDRRRWERFVSRIY